MADIAVIGVPDERWGEAVKAVVVPAPGAAPDPGELAEFARTRLAGYKVPRSFDFVDELVAAQSVGKDTQALAGGPFWQGRERQVN